MKAYVVKRLLISFPLLFAMSFVMFGVMSFSGQDFFSRLQKDPTVSKAYVQELRRAAGAQHPWPVRYLYWLRGVCFDVRFHHPERTFVAFEDPDVMGAYGVTGGGETRPVDHGLEGKALLINGQGAAARAVVRKFDNPNPGWDAPVDYDEQGETGRVEVAETWRRWWRARAAAHDDWARWWAGMRKEADELSVAEVVEAAIQSIESSEKAETEGALATLRRLYRRDAFFWDQSAYEKVRFDVRRPESWRELEDQPGSETVTVKIGVISSEVADSVLLAIDGGWPAEVVAIGTATVEVGGEATLEANLVDLGIRGVDLARIKGVLVQVEGDGAVEVDDFRLLEGPGSVGPWGLPFRLGAPDFGYSYALKKPVFEVLLPRLKNSILLTLGAFFTMYLVALPIGIYSAVNQYTVGDKLASLLAFVGMAVPDFLMSTLAIFAISQTIEIPPESWMHFWPWDGAVLPIGGRTSDGYENFTRIQQFRDVLWHSIAPILIIAAASMAGLMRIMRGNMLEVLRQQYVTTARAKGLTEGQVVYKHALRNAVTPFVVAIGSLIPALLGGAAFVEIIFSYPGIGELMLNAIRQFDTYLVMADLMAAGVLLVVGNVVADVLLAFVDPRISYA